MVESVEFSISKTYLVPPHHRRNWVRAESERPQQLQDLRTRRARRADRPPSRTWGSPDHGGSTRLRSSPAKEETHINILHHY